MIYPTVSLAGSARDALVEQYATAIAALDRAIEAIDPCTPKPADYPDGEPFWKQAMVEHHSRLLRLQSIRRDYSLIAAKLAPEPKP